MAVDLTSGSASDAIKQLLQTSYDRSNSLFGQSNGLSPEAMSALQTQGTAGINQQYQQAAQNLNTQLLRRGAVGQAQLPGSGGDIARAYQPLYSSMADAQAKAQRDTILANEAQKQQTLYQNNQLAQGALSSAGGFANDLASLEPGSLRNMLLTSLLSSAANPGGGILGALTTGAGTNSTGSHGILGDLLGGVTGSGANLPAAPDNGNVYGPATTGSVPYGPANPASTSDYSTITSALAGTGGTLASLAALPSVADAAGAAAGLPVLGGALAGSGGVSATLPEVDALAASLGAPAATDTAAGGITGALGLGGGEGLLGLGALTLPVIGAGALGVYLLAKHFFGNGGDRIAANQLTAPGGPHDYWVQATEQLKQLPDGPEKDSAVNVRDRAFEQALLAFSKIDKDHYYQAKKTLEQFAGFSTVRPLLG